MYGKEGQIYWHILTYGSETWTMTVGKANTLRIFERKIMRKIYGPIQERKCWRIRTNKKIKDILQEEDTVKFIKSWDLCLFGARLDMCGKSCPHRSLNPKYFIFDIKYIRVLKFVNCSVWDFSFSWPFISLPLHPLFFWGGDYRRLVPTDQEETMGLAG